MASVIGSVAVRVTPSFSGLNMGISKGFRGTEKSSRSAGERSGKSFVGSFSNAIGRATSSVRRAAGRVTSALTDGLSRTASRVTGVAREIGTRFVAALPDPIRRGASRIGSAVSSAFSSSRAAVSGAATRVSGWFTSLVPEGIRKGAGRIGSAVSNVFSSSRAAVSGAATRVSGWFSETLGSRLRRSQPQIATEISKPFTGAMSGVVSAGNQIGVSFSGATASSLGSKVGAVQSQAMKPFSGVLAGIPNMASATGLSFTGAVSSSLSQGASTAGDGFISTLGSKISAGFSSLAQGAETHGISLGSTFGQGFVGQFTKMLGPLAGILGVGTIIGGGFNRLAQIDQAEAKFRGLGLSAQEIETQMDAALESVMGTQVGLDQAATAAVGATGAGVEMGQDMTDWLKSIADATALSNTEYDHMALIMNKVQGQGELMLGDIRQLSQNGFEAASILKDHLGVESVAAVEELASQGEISAAVFQEAIESQIGGASQEVSKTLSGSVTEAMFQLKILGAAFLESSGLIEVFRNVMMGFGSFLEDVVTPAVTRFFDYIRENADTIRPIATVVAGVVAGFAAFKLAATGIAFVPVLLRGIQAALFGIGGAIRAIPFIGWVAMAVSGLIAFFKYTETGQKLWERITSWFQSTVVPIFRRVWGAISEGAGEMWERIGPTVTRIWEAVKSFGAWLWATAVPLIQSAWSGLGDGLSWVWESIIKPVWGWIKGAVSDFMDWAMNTARPRIMEVWDSAFGLLSTIWETVLRPVFGWIRDAWNNLTSGMSSDNDSWMKPIWDGLITTLGWLWNNVAKPVFGFLWAGFKTMSSIMFTVWTTVLKGLFDGLASIITWVATVAAPKAFNFLKTAWNTVATTFRWVWNNLLKPVFNFFSTTVSWLWNSVARPLFRFISDRFTAVGDTFKKIWDGFLQPVFQLFADVIRWLWNTFVKPYFRSIWEQWVRMKDILVAAWTKHIWPMIKSFGQWIKDLWEAQIRPRLERIQRRWRILQEAMVRLWRVHIRPMIQAFGDRIKELYNNYVKPALGWIKDRWDWLKDRISSLWNDKLKPIFEAVGDFIKEDLVDRVKSGVETVKDTWNTLANAFRKPINWVINTVWNNGLRKAFNGVAKAVGSDARISEIGTIPRFGGKDLPGYAKGGRTKRGWSMVGEEGPEIVWMNGNEVVSTASQTREIMANGLKEEGEDVDPKQERKLIGSSPSQSLLPAGGGMLSRAANWVSDRVSGAIEWIRGGFAKVAEGIIMPLLKPVTSTMSQYGLAGTAGADLVEWGADSVLDWIRGEDDKGGEFGASGEKFSGPTGAWRRPSVGPITSWYGPRWGGHHAGVDIAGGGPTYAAYNGIVSRTGWNIVPGRTGIGILLNHGENLYTYYGHNPVGGVKVSPGDQVSAGQRIGAQGATGNVTGVHLHWEMHRGGIGRDVNVNSLLRDKGGLLPPGLSMVRNETGGYEYTSNQRQFDNLNRMAEQATEGGGAGMTVYQYGMDYRDSEGVAVAISRERRRAARGGAHV